MIAIDLKRHQDNRPHRLVATCSPCLWIVLALIWFASAPLHASVVMLSADTTLPRVDFAVSELRGALTAAGHAVTTTGLDALPDDEMPTRIVMANQQQTAIIDRMLKQGAKLATPLQQLHASSDEALQILDQFPKVTEKELKRTPPVC